MPQKVLLLAPVLPTDVLATASILENAELLESLVTRGVTTRRIERLLPRSTITRSVSPVAKERTEAKWTADLVFYLTLAFTQSRTRASDWSFAFLDRRPANQPRRRRGARARRLLPPNFSLRKASWRHDHLSVADSLLADSSRDHGARVRRIPEHLQSGK